ncbi:thioester-containing protein 1 allele R1-like [Calliphora vicina]|uniref:thioester-containing protein 1 allele R1-like n=1 Tax=Calliphora vicina TaxID=7373 RepID=UPI00325B5011
MQRKWLHLLLIGHIWTVVICKSYYSILAPGIIKSNRKYTASVTLHEADGPVTIRLGIARTPSFYTFQDVSLQSFQTKTIDFDLPKLNKDFKYELIAEGIEGLSFKNSTKLLVEDCKALRVYMQTSKGTYKPEDLVQFRVIILDVHLKPVKLNEPVRVQILDAKDHRVKQFKNIHLIKGIFSGSIQLSEHPNLGYWKILVSISGKYNIREMKPFKVDKYVLPKFSVHLDTVDDFVHEDQILPVTVYGKYVYGRYVEGKVIAKVMIGKVVFEMQTKDIQEYKAKFEFNVSNHLTYAEVEPYFDVEVSLIDKYTNVSMSSKKTIQHHNQRYRIVVPIEEIEFRDNLPFLIKAKVRYLNDTEVNDRTTPIFMKHGGKVYQSLLDEHGMTSFIFDYEHDKSNEFFFKKTSLYLSNLFYNGQTNNESLCNLKVKTGKINLDQVVDVEVSSTSYIPYLIYVLVGHSNIIKTGYVQLEADQNSYIIKINPTIEMVPLIDFSVHYLYRGVLNFCDIQISFPNEFENKITISTSNITVEPGQKVNLNIQAQQQSRVGLLAVDLSAHLLNSNYTLNKQQIIKELLNDQLYTDYSYIGFGKLCGLVTFTNADVVNISPKSFSGIYRRTRSPRMSKALPNSQPLVRTKFPETWIFKEIEILNENTSLSLNIPDTITTWLVTAISINELSGLGIMDDPLNITVFRPFFISTNLPYSIKRGETIAIPLTIFNYYEQNLSCQIIMNNTNDEFQFMDDDDGNNVLHLTQVIKNVTVAANSGTSVAFKVKALKLGQLNVQITALSPLAGDAIEQQLKVEPEGILIKDNQEIYLKLQPETESVQNSLFIAHIPQDIVPESEFLRLSIGGDTLLPSVENLNNLIRLPTGCGEQNMINFAPNISVLDYLKSVGKWQKNSEMVVKAVHFIETGYQNELTFRHNTGGYSVFGSEGTESTWLTAYVVRFFIKAVKYVAVEPEIIKSGLDFLASHQQTNGEFQHTGHLFYPAHQNRYGFTAFVLMSFMENMRYRKQYESVIQKGLEFLTSNVNSTSEAYALSIMAATLQMAQSDMVPLIRNKLLAMQHNEDNHKWWTSADKKQSNDVEITAYVLMALLETGGTEPFSIFNWLIKQRCENGGFRTTHETVVGLQALIKFNEKYSHLHETLINVNFTAKDAQGVEVKQGILEVTADNFMILQRLELPHTTRSIQYVAQGQGNSLLQFSYHYYVTEDKPLTDNSTNEDNVPQPNTLETLNISPRLGKSFDFKKSQKQPRFAFKEQSFVIKPLAKMSSAREMLLEVCFKYQPSDNLQIQKTNMIILEIYLPSGFVSNPNNIQELLEEELITKVELKDSDTRIIMYFDQLQAKDELCLNVQADKVFDVQLLKPSTIEMYDFYNTNLQNSVCYEIIGLWKE